MAVAGYRLVFPTCVGVFLLHGMPSVRSGRLPHVRGGVSPHSVIVSVQTGSSPRAWGCFYITTTFAAVAWVFPTCVGVFPERFSDAAALLCLPHVRGGVSFFPGALGLGGLSSPRAWGCFLRRRRILGLARVFPTCVGVFPGRSVMACIRCCLPHVRGGVSESSGEESGRTGSSPRAWGCFWPPQKEVHNMPVFPTCVGVFPIQLIQ